MTLENASLELGDCLKVLRESTADLLRLITEDRPYEHSLAYRFEHAANDALGRLNASLDAGLTLQQMADHYDYGQACNALGICHAEFNQAAEKIYGELKSFDWLQDLYSLGNEHPDEWMGWATSIKATLDQCHLSAVHEALLRCWQSLLVSSGALATRQVKNVGRQLTSLKRSESIEPGV
jgi:hypothetical protein